MLLTKTIQVKWNAKTKKHYVDKGYAFTHMGDSFEVSVEDLTPGSNVKVDVKCDYCGAVNKVSWYSYISIKARSEISADACKDCTRLKADMAVNKKYGSHSEMFKASNSKREQTIMERYGVHNVYQSEDIKEKIKQTCIEKYGVPFAAQSEDVANKRMNACIEKYGVNHYVELFKGRFIKENSPTWKGGATVSRAERATHEYIQWRKSVFAKDGYTCVCCGSKSGCGHSVKLNAHHIMNWKDNQESRYDVVNGVTLCQKCHMDFHSQYGKKNNTSEQLNEFIEIKRYAELMGTKP